MPDLIAVFYRYWKFIAFVTLSATLVAVAIAALLPKHYVSTATALPASSFAADKSTIFNTNIQELYSALGTADDLDQIIGTARLDTIYIAAVGDLDLAAHYGLPADESGRAAAVQRLKRRTSVAKSEWGELKIKVWDTDRNWAAQLANGLLKKLQGLHQALRNQSNQLVLQKLQEVYHATKFSDTAPHQTTPVGIEASQLSQRQQYEQLLSEYNLMVATNPPVLLVVENARPALYPDNSEKLASVILTFFAALLFSFLIALYTESKKRRT